MQTCASELKGRIIFLRRYPCKITNIIFMQQMCGAASFVLASLTGGFVLGLSACTKHYATCCNVL